MAAAQRTTRSPASGAVLPTRRRQTGFLLVGIVSDVRPSGGFLSGYLPTEHTREGDAPEGRIVHEIDGRPAALVYNAWAGGAISRSSMEETSFSRRISCRSRATRGSR